MRFPVLKPSIRTIAILAAIAGLLCISGILVYMVGSGQLKAKAKKLAEIETQVDGSQRIAARLETARTKYINAQTELCFLETSVSTYAYVPTLLGQLEQLGKAHNLKVVSVRPEAIPPPAPYKPKAEGESATASTAKEKKKEKPKPYQELKINIELEGSYWCVHDFMLSLTKFPKIVAVKEITVAPSDSANTPISPKLKASLVVTAFIFKPEAGKVDTPKPAFTPPALKKASVSAGRSNNEG